jgi:(1->4)-alpha-D-glucan 1-alpha-D-glucosylmutase
LREVIACFPVYRTYVRCTGWEVDPDDLGRIAQAVRMAKRRNPSMPRAVFDFVSAVLTLSFPPELEKREREAWREFTLRFQQVTGPVTAKGVEDTAFYRYVPLASLNEVGGEITLPSIQPAEFHRLMKLRCEIWPHGLSATATHDTKRGEDTRARLHVLSEVPDEWQELLLEYDRLADSVVRDVDGQRAPDNLELYLLLQTLVGTWPKRGHRPDAPLCYGDRICE